MTDKEIKVRNTQLCRDWIDWHDSDAPKQEPVSAFMLVLTKRFGITEQYVYEILRQNSGFILQDKNEEKIKRIFRLKREVAGKDKSNKDVADLLEQLRREFEGDKPTVQNNITNVVVSVKELSASDLRTEYSLTH